MTQAIALNGQAPEINPLYIKLRRHFANEDNRTIGEVKIQQAIRDGYQPYAAPARRASSRSVSEYHVTRANSLPKASGTVKRKASASLSGGAIALILLCACLFSVLLFSGLHINELKGELDGLRHPSGLQVNEEVLTLAPNAPSEYDASGEADTALSNLLRAFSEK